MPDLAPFSHHASEGNRVRLLTEGDEALELFGEAVERARERVWLETYIFEPDATGQHVLEALTRAARRGCDVVLIIDRFGSKNLWPPHVRALRRAGGTVVWFNPLTGLGHSQRKVTPFALHRDHRKLVVIDDALALCGGRNVSLDYVGGGTDEFFDTVVAVRGPAVQGFAAAFADTLAQASPFRRDAGPLPPPLPGGVRADVLALDASRGVDTLDRALADLVVRAERRVLFVTPYLIPPAVHLAALLEAARRGVAVHVLTAGQSDARHVQWAARHLYPTLLEAGVRLYKLHGDMLHAKFFTADDRVSLVGSYNADRWGQRYNKEIAVRVECETLARRFAECFADALRRGGEFTPDDHHGPLARASQALAYGLSHVLAPDASPRPAGTERGVRVANA